MARAPAVDPKRWFDRPPDPSKTPAVTLEQLLPRLVRAAIPMPWVVRTTAEDAARSAIEQLSELPTLLRLAANQDTVLLDSARLAAGVQVSPPTLRRHLSLLVEVFLVILLPAWTPGYPRSPHQVTQGGRGRQRPVDPPAWGRTP